MNALVGLGLYHPAAFLGICGVLVLNAYVIWRRRRAMEVTG